jgi:hypothetical protein
VYYSGKSIADQEDHACCPAHHNISTLQVINPKKPFLAYSKVKECVSVVPARLATFEAAEL